MPRAIMPGKTKKDLHIAHSVGELNRMAEHALKGTPNPKVYLRTSEQVFKKAEEFNLLGDEESAYIMYMRFFNLITSIKKTADYKKNEKYYNEMIGTKNSIRAITQAEVLSGSLKNRYEEREAEEVSKKLEALSLKREREKEAEKEKEKSELELGSQKEGKEEEDSNKPENLKNEDNDKNENTQNGQRKVCMGVHELYVLLTKSPESVLVMDIRPPDQFTASHISHQSCINVPAEIIPPGTTVSYIEKALPEASKSLWKQRDSIDHIVMLDWCCDGSSLAPPSTLASLKDALYKWDYYTRLKCEPVVLEGGYDEWLTFYPTMSTNSNVPRPHDRNKLDMDFSLDNIKYELDQAFLDSPEDSPAPSDKLPHTEQESESEQINEQLKRNLIPAIDRSLKPRPVVGMNNQSTTFGNTNKRSYKGVDLDVIKNELRQELIDENDSESVNINKLPSSSNSLTSKISQATGPKVNNIPSSIPPILSPKVSNLPGVNRALKPRLDTAEGSALANEAHEAARKAVMKAQEELNVHKLETKRLIEERRARIAALEAEEKKLEAVKQIKKKELAETADVMRAKKRIQNELADLESVKKKAEREELERQKELEGLKREENEKLKWRQEAERLRSLKKRPEQEDIPPIKPDDAETLSSRLEKKKPEAPNEKETVFEKKEAEKRTPHTLTEKKERHEREKQTHEEMQELARAAEIKRLQKEKVEKERIERENRMAAQREAEVGTSLPVGWQKKMDPITGQYKYVDPNKGIYQTPPGSPKHSGTTDSKPNQHVPGRSTPTGPSTPEKRGDLYKTKLKDETDTPRSGGLRRSHSSPNIAQMVQEPEALEPLRPFMPSVDRGNKPRSPRPEFQMVPAKTEVSAAKVRNLQPTWGNVGRGLTGLRNLGNTCYMNSTIQCLSNTTFLTTYFLTDNYRPDINRENCLGKKGEVAEEFAVLIKALWTGQYRAINPRDFKSVISKHHPLFAGFDQQDSQEMLLFLLDSLHEDLNKIRKRMKIADQDNDGLPDKIAADKAWAIHKRLNDSVIVDLFQGQFMSTVTCMTCERKSVTFDTFMYLTVPIPSKMRCSIRDCILHFAKEEKMTGDSRWLCPGCKRNRDAIKRIVIWRLPRILLIHLKRFYYQGMWRQKINAFVDFPLDGLDMNHYIQSPQKIGSYSLYAVSVSNLEIRTAARSEETPELLYRRLKILQTAWNHYGTMEGGHYTAFCKSPSNSHWYKYDDHEVYEIPRSDIKSSAAYILYYSSIRQDLQFAS